MHLKGSSSHEEARPAKLFLLAVVAQDVADILTKEAFNALTKLLHAIDVPLVHLPHDTSPWLERRDLPIDAEVPGNVSHQILDHWESLHGKDSDGLIKWKRVHACFAREPRPAIDLG
jgi:hypothetical protein